MSTSNDLPAGDTDRPAVPVSGRLSAGERAAAVPWFLDPAEILLTLRLRWPWVVIPPLAAGGLALGLLVAVPTHYTASAELLIDPQGLQVVKDDLTPPGQTNDASLLLVDSQMQVVSSDDVLRKVVDRFALDRDPAFNGRGGIIAEAIASVAALLHTTAAPHDAKLDALRTLRERLTVRRTERTFALTLAVTTNDRDLSARIAQGIADIYLANDGQVRADLARRAGAALTSRLGELQAEVQDAEDKAQAFRTAQNLVGTRTQLVSEQQLGQIAEQLGAARAQAAAQRSRLDQVQAALKSGGSLDALPEVLQSATITQLRTQLASAERAYADQATRLGSRHPALIAAASAVTVARAQLAGEVRRIAASVRDTYKASAGNVAALSASLDQGKSEAVAVGGAMVRMRELDRQVDARRSVYETFLVRARELQAQQQLGTSASRIISPATPPARRDGPPTLALVGAAVMAGLGCGIGGALIRERNSGKVRTARRLAGRLGVPVVGALPPAAGEALVPGPADLSAASRYDLAAMRLRNHLWGAGLAPGGRLIVVTAADPQSGKARLAMKLAMVAAADGDRVLLVDADPDGTLPDSFGLPVIPLVGRTLETRTALPERGVAQMPSLRYIGVSRRAAKLEFRAVADGIARRVADFDATIVNAGLLGADLFTERLVTDPRLTGILLAVSASRSRFSALDHALGKLDTAFSLQAALTDAAPRDL